MTQPTPPDPAPTPAPFPSDIADDIKNYVWQYWLNASLVVLTVLAVVENVIQAMNITGAWLGLSDVAWHWVVFVLAVATALNTALNHTPRITRPPTEARLRLLRTHLRAPD